MNAKRIIGASLLACSGAGLARQPDADFGAGDLVVQVGYFHLDTHDSSEPVRTELRPSPALALLGVPESFTSEGSGLRVGNSDTPAFTAKYFLTDHWSLQIEGGLPADFDVYGYGVVAPPGLLGRLVNADLGDPASNPAASSRQWSPAMILHYHFREPAAGFRPYIGGGVVYTWFTDVELTPAADAAINSLLGTTLAAAAGISGDTYTDAESSSSWDPVVNIGVQAQFTERWGMSLSAAYLPLTTTSTIRIKASDGTTLATNRIDLDIDTVVFALLANYRF